MHILVVAREARPRGGRPNQPAHRERRVRVWPNV